MSGIPSPRTRAASLLPLLAAGLMAPGIAPAKAPPTGLAACAAIEADLERLACYDRASGRKAAPKAGAAGAVAAAPVSGPAVAQSIPASSAPAAVQDAAPATQVASAPVSMIDAAWGLNPDSSRYLISLYRPNYFLLGRYSDRPNEAPFDVLFNAFDNPEAELDSTEAEFQLSFKARL